MVPFAAHAADAPGSAAELDWVPATGAVNAGECRGRYVEPPLAPAPPQGEVSATANSSQHVLDGGTLFVGDVVVRESSREIRSPRISVDAASNEANIEGPVIMREPGVVMMGSHATADLLTGEGVIDDATFLFHPARLRGGARTLSKAPDGAIHLQDGEFTRCDPSSNDWSFAGKDIVVDPEKGFGTAKQVTLRIGGVPVAWFPWIRFPIDDERHTGFLLPGAGYDSSGGTDITVPFYFNLAPQYDLTYQPRSLWRRGLVHEAQFRFLAGKSANELNAAFLANDDIYDPRGVLDETSSGTDTSGAGIENFVPQDRWYLNFRHSGGWSSRFKSTVNYNAISDPDYLDDIGGNLSSSGLDAYVNSVDQALASRRAPALDRMGSISYRGDGWNSSLSVQEYQIIDARTPAQYEVLPRLGVDTSHHFGDLKVSATAEFASFDKDNAGLTGITGIVGNRTVLTSAASWRKARPWGYIEPAVGMTYRAYDLRDTPSTSRSNPTIATPRFSLDAGLVFDRFFDFRGSRYQQTLEPRAFYLWVEADEQNDLPLFDTGPLTPGYAQLFRVNRYRGFDRIGDANQVSLGLTTRILDPATGFQFIEASVGQIQYLDDRQVTYAQNRVYSPTAERSPLFLQAGINIGKALRIGGTYEWEPEVNRSNRGTVSIRYRGKDQRLLNLTYVETSPDVQSTSLVRSSEESYLSFIWPVHGHWSAIGEWNFSWDRNQTIESVAGLEYDDCCWRSRIVVRRFLKEPKQVSVVIDDPAGTGGFVTESRMITPADTGIFFEFQMKGLATLGRRLDLLLEQAIPGYREREATVGN